MLVFPGSFADKEYLQCRRPWFDFEFMKICRGKDKLPIPVFLGFPGGSDDKNSACNARDLGWIPELYI